MVMCRSEVLFYCRNKSQSICLKMRYFYHKIANLIQVCHKTSGEKIKQSKAKYSLFYNFRKVGDHDQIKP